MTATGTRTRRPSGRISKSSASPLLTFASLGIVIRFLESTWSNMAAPSFPSAYTHMRQIGNTHIPQCPQNATIRTPAVTGIFSPNAIHFHLPGGNEKCIYRFRRKGVEPPEYPFPEIPVLRYQYPSIGVCGTENPFVWCSR